MKKAVVALVIGLFLLVMPVMAQSTSSISYGETVSGTISDAAEVELWEFEGTVGDVVTITIIADASSNLDTRLYLYTVAERNAGQPAIAENDDSGDETIGNFNSQIAEFELPESTTYIIEATRFSGEGDYELTLSAGENEGGEIQFIEYGAEATGTITELSSSQTFEFLGDAGDVVTITMIADASSSLDTRLFLFDEDGYLTNGVAIAENDDSGDTTIGLLNAQIAEFELPEDGFYYIEATSFSSDGDYTLTLESDAMSAGVEIRQWATFATGTTQYGEDSWSFMQATGEPNTATCGDHSTAWASSSSTGSDTLALEFDTPVRASEINIYQTYNPGSIIRVELSNTVSGEIVEIPNSADPLGNTPCPGVFTLAVPELDLLADGVLIYLDQTIGGSWNEIDAVELVGIDPTASADEATTIDFGTLNTVSHVFASGAEIEIDAPSEFFTQGDDEGYYYIASSESVLNDVIAGNSEALPAGELGITVALPGTFDILLGLAPDATARQALEGFVTAISSTGEVEEYPFLNDNAVYTEMIGELVPPNTVVIVTDNEDGIFFFAVQIGSDMTFASVEDTIIEMINSLSYTSN